MPPYDGRMTPTASLQGTLADLAHSVVRWLGGWWRMAHLGAQLLTLALSPSSYTAQHRRVLARHLYLGTAPSLLGFIVLSTLLSLVLIRC